METKFKFRFYLDNEIAKAFELNEESLKERFIDWMKNKDVKWLEYYCFQLANIFIQDTDGLCSTMDNTKCYEKVSEILQDTKWKYLNSIGIK